MLLERVRAMRPERKLELKTQFVPIPAVRVPHKTVLSADLAELARPVCKDGGKAGVGQV